MALTHTALVEVETFVAQLRARLGDSAFEAAWAHGQRLSLDQIMALALDETQIPQ
jgi:hypothetical protein